MSIYMLSFYFLWLVSIVTSITEKYGIVVTIRNGVNPGQFVYKPDLLSELKKNIHTVTE